MAKEVATQQKVEYLQIGHCHFETSDYPYCVLCPKTYKPLNSKDFVSNVFEPA